MSSHSYVDQCPKCGSESLQINQDTRPYDKVDALCLDCGFGYYTKEENYTLEELNEQRVMFDLEPLKELKGGYNVTDL